MGLLQRGDLPMNLFIFFFLLFSTQVINFQGNNLSKFGAIHMNPIEGQPQLLLSLSCLIHLLLIF